MRRFFFDTSAFAKRYHTEQGSLKVREIFASKARVLQVSNLGILETQSAIAVKTRMGLITSDDALALRQLVLNDIANGAVKLILLEAKHIAFAGELVARYSLTRRLRTLDALQLAMAIDLANDNLLDDFVVADKLLAEIAALEGLSIINPEES